MKWCNRVFRLYKLSTSSHASIKEYIFCEAVDCFSGMIAKTHLRNKFVQLIGLAWDLSPDRLHFYMNLNKPTINVAPTTASVGRVTLVREQKVKKDGKYSLFFSLCINQNRILRILCFLCNCWKKSQFVCSCQNLFYLWERRELVKQLLCSI